MIDPREDARRDAEALHAAHQPDDTDNCVVCRVRYPCEIAAVAGEALVRLAHRDDVLTHPAPSPDGNPE